MINSYIYLRWKKESIGTCSMLVGISCTCIDRKNLKVYLCTLCHFTLYAPIDQYTILEYCRAVKRMK